MFLSTSLSLKAQTILATGLNDPFHVVINGSDLYISDFKANKIVKLDLSVSPAIKTDFKTGLDSPNGIAVLGNDVYVVEWGNGKIVKINTISKQQTTVVTGIPRGDIEGIAFKGNDLYLAVTSKISKITITGTLPIAYTTSSTVVTGLNISYELAFKGNELYLSDYGASKLLKKDITTSGTVATEVFSGTIIQGLLFNENDLYITGDATGKISKIDITKTPAVTEDVITGLSFPRGVAIYNDSLYVIEKTQVLKYPFPCTPNKPSVTKSGSALSTIAVTGATYQWLNCGSNNAPITGATANTHTATANGSYAVEVTSPNNCKDTSVCIVVTGVGVIENTFASNVKLYPNPTNKDITVELGDSYTDLKLDLVNILGQVIAIKQVDETTNKVILPIEASSGIYFLRLSAREGFASFRIIKE